MPEVLTPLLLPHVAPAPAAPATGHTLLYADSALLPGVPAWRNALGAVNAFQASFHGRLIWLILPSTANARSTLGPDFTLFGASATLVHVTPTSTNALTSTYRVRLGTGAATNLYAEFLAPSAGAVWRGNAAGLGGFLYHCRFGFSTQIALQRAFAGLAASGASPWGNVSPDSVLNMVGFGNNSGDTQLQVYTNDGSGTATRVALGSGFTLGTTDLYDVFLFCAPNAASIDYLALNVSTGAVASGTLSSDLPDAATFLSPHVLLNKSTTAQIAQIDFSRLLYLESDF